MPNRTPRPSSTARGLGHNHQQHRARLLLRHIDGRPCWCCDRPMYKDPKRNYDGRTLHADHSRARSTVGVGNSTADRLLHATCNEQRGDGSHDDQRPALTRRAGTADRGADSDLGELCYFDWPALT